MSTQPVIYNVSIWSKPFWQGAAERAIKTFAQAFIAVFGVGTTVEVTGSTLNTDTWVLALVSGGAAAVLSVVMSLASPAFTAGEKANVPLSAPQPEGVVIPDGDGVHRAENTEPDPAGSTTVDDAPIVTETTVKAEEY